MPQGYTALNTMFMKIFQKQTTFISPKDIEKQIDCHVNKKKTSENINDAEVTDKRDRSTQNAKSISITMLEFEKNNKKWWKQKIPPPEKEMKDKWENVAAVEANRTQSAVHKRLKEEGKLTGCSSSEWAKRSGRVYVYIVTT